MDIAREDDCCAVCAAARGHGHGHGASHEHHHEHHHDHAEHAEEDEGEGRYIRFGSYALPLKRLVIFGSALCLWGAGLGVTHFGPVTGMGRFLPLVPFVAAYFLAGLPVLRNAFRHILQGRALDENFLMAIATIGAFLIGEWEEAVGVMIFYMIGELVQEAAVTRSRRSINALLALKPDTARVQDGDGWTTSAASAVAVGALVLVRPGERIPLDGIVVGGEGAIDASMLSGESRPVDVKAGDEVRSGTMSVDGVLTIRTTKTADDSSAARIIALVELIHTKFVPGIASRKLVKGGNRRNLSK
jgi:Cd2+/Zn2+-exporting ATPase